MRHTNIIKILIAGMLVLTAVAAAAAPIRFSISKIDNSDGLSSNNVKAIHRDRFGFMWFGTKNGLNRYDGLSVRRFNCYDPTTRRGNNNISSIFERNDSLWVGTDRGVYIYDMRREVFTHMGLRSREGIAADDWVETIFGDSDGNIWVLIPNQGVFRINGKAMDYYSVTDHGGDKGKLPQCITAVGDEIFVGTSFQGLFKYDRSSNCFKQAGPPDVRQRFSGMLISVLAPMTDHDILLGDTNGNLLCLDIHSGDMREIPFSAAGHVYLRKVCRLGDELWIGTQGGICILDLNDGSETRVTTETMGESAFTDNVIYTFYPDDKGNLWIGTLFGGVNYFQRTGLVFEYFTKGSSQRSLSGNLLRGMAYTPGKVWMGYEDGGLDALDVATCTIDRSMTDRIPEKSVLNLQSIGNTVMAGSVRHGLSVFDADSRAVSNMCSNLHGSDNSVYAMLEDSKGNLWVGLEWGLYFRPNGSGEFSNVTELGYDWISNIYETRDGRIWITTMGNGAWMFDPLKRKFFHYGFDEQYSNGLRSNSVSSVFEDSKGRIWLTTDRGGLSLFNPDTQKFTTYSSEEGLPDNVVYNVLEDKLGNLWFGTNSGLVKMDPATQKIKTFSSHRGTMPRGFSYNSAVADEDGYFYFGGLGGVVRFDPLKDVDTDSLPPLYLTRMRIGNEEVTPGDDSPLKENLLFTRTIEVPHSAATISFNVALPYYANNQTVVYSYRLLPTDKEWIYITNPRNLSFVGLLPGDYDLELRAENGTNQSVNTYKLSVLPSWYESWWAYLIYASIFGGLLLTGWCYYRYRQERQMIKMANEMSIRKEKDLYKNKIQFFTEIAHEIRTPLSLIGSPLEAIDEIGVRDERVERYLKIIRMNANRLLDLTTHLLDFQKIDGNQPSLNFENVDVTALVQKIFSRFELTMSLKNKTVTASLPDKSIFATIDPEAITKIISNLFNNALKYSDSAIEIALTADAGKFTLAVASDGARIEGEHRLRIFEPFYQIDPETSHAGGVGIGLPLASSLAKLHSGSLTLADTSTLANTFVLEIPLHQENVEVDNDSNPVMAEFVMEEDNAVSTADRAYSMLFVEDNADMRDFLYDQLSRSFNIETAVNGVEALKLLAERRFDIVVTDIMMPAMDGYELCSRIKENVDSSNIPVVFLTAKNDLDSKLKALKCGGEAYIEKPFSIKYFRQQIMSLLDNRQHERKAFLKKPFFTIDSMKLNKADEEFMNKVVKIVTDNIADENFSVEAMAEAFCMSRSSLLRRIKTLFNLSPVELIRLIKLKKAAELIQEGKYRIGDVCFMVGINSSSYFSKLFFKQFGVTPKAFEKQCQKNSAPAKLDDITPGAPEN